MAANIGGAVRKGLVGGIIVGIFVIVLNMIAASLPMLAGILTGFNTADMVSLFISLIGVMIIVNLVAEYFPQLKRQM